VTLSLTQSLSIPRLGGIDFGLRQPFLASPQTMNPRFIGLESEEGGSNFSGMICPFREKTIGHRDEPPRGFVL